MSNEIQKKLEERIKDNAYVVYSRDRYNRGFYCGWYVFQGEKFGIFENNFDAAKTNRLKIYSSRKRAQSVLDMIHLNNWSSTYDLEIRIIDKNTLEEIY